LGGFGRPFYAALGSIPERPSNKGQDEKDGDGAPKPPCPSQHQPGSRTTIRNGTFDYQEATEARK
jgi:hypothetical protein